MMCLALMLLNLIYFVSDKALVGSTDRSRIIGKSRVMLF